jgi:phosphoglycerol transferase MdoB-like AlkP superfamily enzyme
MSLESAVKISKEALFTARDIPFKDDYPLERSLKPRGKEKYNFFIVLLEGWNPYYIDGLQGKANFKATPNFDKIIKEAVVFPNAYAAGSRSIFGYSSAFLGVPMLPSLPMLGYGMELRGLTAPGKAFSKKGYYTVFAQASFCDSYRMCSLAHGVLGMSETYGRENMPELLPYKQKADFGFDYDMLMFTADKVKNHKNFLALTFTAITHEPWCITLEQFELYPRDSRENEYLNALAYADYSVGSLIEKSKKDGWHDNTVFIFLSDHNSGTLGRGTIAGYYRIPFVIYAPKILKPERDLRVVSQLDLLPTLYDLGNIGDAYSALGKSAFASGKEFAFFTQGNEIGIITPQGALVHSGQKIIKSEGSLDQDDAARLALALEKSSVSLLKYDKWYGSNL